MLLLAGSLFQQPPTPDLWVQIIKSLPAIGWLVLAVFLIAKFYKPVRYQLLPKISGIKGLGVELQFVQDSLQDAIHFGEAHSGDGKAGIAMPEKNRAWNIKVPEEDAKRVITRIRQHLRLLQGSRILWLDDNPANNGNERKLLSELFVVVDTATSKDEALQLLKAGSFDLVISDMRRGEDEAAGIAFLKMHLAQNPSGPPVVFYLGTLNPELGTPPGAFGITNRPDELLHLILDILERKRTRD